ncbi:MAG: DUF421 domain-containing protein [Acidimicrobiia bacterium]|nr:DUF421 domain-containing protein [Acidimicrobiia bacterium]
MASDLFDNGIPVGEKVIRTVAVYGGLLLLLRLAGKRDLAQLNSFDFVVLLLLSNVVQNAVIGADNSLSGGLLGAAVLVGVNALLVRVAGRNEAVVALVEGTPSTLVSDGRVDEVMVGRLGLRRADVISALRRQGADRLEDVAQATLEPGGTISVQLRTDAMDATKADVARLEAKLDLLLARSA